MAELMNLKIPMGRAVLDNKFYDVDPKKGNIDNNKVKRLIIKNLVK